MSNTQMIIDALLVQPTPNMPASYAEDHLTNMQEQLMSLVRGELSATVASQSILDKFLQEPQIWEGPLADVLANQEIEQNAVIVETAQKIHELAHPVDPANSPVND